MNVEYFLSLGLLMGLVAGLTPGPLLTLVIAQSLQYGIAAGVKVALAPVMTDAPIIFLMLLLVGQLSGFTSIIGLLSIVGSGYVFYMAYDTAKPKQPLTQRSQDKARSISKGVLSNVLSPHPYVFWLTVGAPTIIQANSVNRLAPLLFIVGFYLPLAGSKILLAIVLGKYRTLLSGKIYANIMRCLAVLLSLFAVLLFLDGLKLLGVWHEPNKVIGLIRAIGQG